MLAKMNILKTFQMKEKNHVMMLAKRKILKTIQMKAKNHVMMLEKRKILKIFQMKVKNSQRPLIAIIQNVMIMNISLQVKKTIQKQFVQILMVVIPSKEQKKNCHNFKRKLKMVYMNTNLIITIQTIAIFPITLKSFLRRVKGTS